MNLERVFEMQRQLDEHIEQEHPTQEGEDRLTKKILALQVELGELANEWRGFKFWSDDRKPRTFKREHCPDCFKKGYYRGNPPKDEEHGTHSLDNHWYYCETCAGHLVITRNPLLEEYVDCLHFILSIGNQLSINPEFKFVGSKLNDTHKGFAIVYRYVAELWWDYHDNNGDAPVTWLHAFHNLLGLGESLGFTQEQIEQAYIEKNEVNHQRQENGY